MLYESSDEPGTCYKIPAGVAPVRGHSQSDSGQVARTRRTRLGPPRDRRRTRAFVTVLLNPGPVTGGGGKVHRDVTCSSFRLQWLLSVLSLGSLRDGRRLAAMARPAAGWRLAGNGIVESFPAPQIPLKWSVPLGPGYCGPTVAGGRVYVMDRQDGAGRGGARPVFR